MTSSYYLAVDVGTSRTAAATARLAPDGSLLATPFALGRSTDSAPSAMFVANGELLFADAAERRGIVEPERLVREFKRRVGDDVPILAGDRRFTPEEIYALTVAWVVDVVGDREGRLPSAIAVTVPVAWGRYRTELVEDALARHGWGSVTLVSEPEAAARHYESTCPLPTGRSLAVYDLGGGTFDAIVLQKDAYGDVHIAGTPVGLGDLGGSDFDDTVLRHALAAAGIDPATVATERMALATLRRECVEAKESLSFDSETVIPVLVGSGHGAVRLTRDELEGMIGDRVSRTADALAEALDSAGVASDDIESILLTGGSSRIPYIAQVLSERFDRPIAVDADPKAIIALGAVRVLSDRASASVETLANTDADELPAPEAQDAPSSGESRVKHRRWRLPAFAYLSAGSLVVALGLVVGSATAMGTGVIDEPGSDAFMDVLAAGLSSGAADAAELPVPGPATPTPTPMYEITPFPSATPGPVGAAPRRTGPKAHASTRTAPGASSKATTTTSAKPGTARSTAAPTLTPTPVKPTGHHTPSATPSAMPTSTSPALPDPTPTDPPASDPTPTDPPASDPTPTDPPTSDPTSTDPPATDPPASDPSETPSPTATLE